MAPRQAGKRIAATSAVLEPPAKRLADQLRQKGVMKSNFQAVVDCINHPLISQAVPEDSRQMLVAALPFSLCVPADERHEHQALIVNMVGEVLELVQAKLQGLLEAKATNLLEVETAKAKLDAALRLLEGDRLAAAESVRERKVALADKSEAMLAAKAAAAQAREEQEQGHAAQEAFTEEKASIEAAVAGPLAQLDAGETRLEDVPGHVKGLVDIAVKLCLDESLVQSLPASLEQPAASRGSFGTLVAAQLHEALTKRIDEIGAMLASSEAAAAERAAVVEATAQDLGAAQETQGRAAAALGAAQEALRAAEAAAEAADAALVGHETYLLLAVQARDERAAELEQFCEFNLACYLSLRDRVSQQRRKELAVEAAARAQAEAAAKAQAEEEALWATAAAAADADHLCEPLAADAAAPDTKSATRSDTAGEVSEIPAQC